MHRPFLHNFLRLNINRGPVGMAYEITRGFNIKKIVITDSYMRPYSNDLGIMHFRVY